MAYAQLDSPLPNLTFSMRGCCGARTLGDVLDTSGSYDYTDLTPPEADSGSVILPENMITPQDLTTLPFPTGTGVPSLESEYPSSIGTEFTLVGPDEYVNIQTGQIVNSATAQAVTGATAGGNAIAQTSGTETGVNLTDPTTGQTYSGALTATAAALNATGQLVTAAGKLTAAGQALAAQGQLIAAPSSMGSSVSAALSSLSTWFTEQSLMAGVPNWGVLAGVGVALTVASSYISSRPKRRKR